MWGVGGKRGGGGGKTHRLADTPKLYRRWQENNPLRQYRIARRCAAGDCGRRSRHRSLPNGIFLSQQDRITRRRETVRSLPRGGGSFASGTRYHSNFGFGRRQVSKPFASTDRNQSVFGMPSDSVLLGASRRF